MVSKEKRILEAVYIENFNVAGLVCEYQPSTGKYNEMSRNEHIDKQMNRGFYVNIDGTLIGVFESKCGPIFFRNNEQFSLKQGHYKMTWIEKTKERNHFSLEINGVQTFLIEYPKSKYIDFDCWSDEERVDFFLWLSKWQDEPKRFHEIFSGKLLPVV